MGNDIRSILKRRITEKHAILAEPETPKKEMLKPEEIFEQRELFFNSREKVEKKYKTHSVQFLEEVHDVLWKVRKDKGVSLSEAAEFAVRIVYSDYF